jgi:hypothetical protein
MCSRINLLSVQANSLHRLSSSRICSSNRFLLANVDGHESYDSAVRSVACSQGGGIPSSDKAVNELLVGELDVIVCWGVEVLGCSGVADRDNPAKVPSYTGESPRADKRGQPSSFAQEAFTWDRTLFAVNGTQSLNSKSINSSCIARCIARLVQ